MCTYVNQSFSYLWPSSAALSFYSRVSRQSAEKAAVILILQSQRCRQQRALKMTWPDAQNWQSQEDSDRVTLACCAWLGCSFLGHGVSAQKRRIIHYGNWDHLCQRQLRSLSCRSADLLHLPLWDHRAVERSGSWAACSEEPSKKLHFPTPGMSHSIASAMCPVVPSLLMWPAV